MRVGFTIRQMTSRIAGNVLRPEALVAGLIGFRVADFIEQSLQAEGDLFSKVRAVVRQLRNGHVRQCGCSVANNAAVFARFAPATPQFIEHHVRIVILIQEQGSGALFHGLSNGLSDLIFIRISRPVYPLGGVMAARGFHGVAKALRHDVAVRPVAEKDESYAFMSLGNETLGCLAKYLSAIYVRSGQTRIIQPYAACQSGHPSDLQVEKRLSCQFARPTHKD